MNDIKKLCIQIILTILIGPPLIMLFIKYLTWLGLQLGLE